MGLLPCLRRGSDRWWLPRGLEATEAIGHLLLADGRNRASERAHSGVPHVTSGEHVAAGQHVGPRDYDRSLHPLDHGDHRPQLDPALRSRVLRALQTDPPLLIFAALSWSGDQVEPIELVDWLASNVTSRFASGDAFLGAPPIESATVSRWNRLRDHFRTLPLERWLEDAPLWLEVTGPKPSSAWREQWPTISPPSNGAAESAEPSSDCMLQQFARIMQRQSSMEASFDAQLRKTKMGAVKQLAYGLSHEINNPLANISTRAQQLQRDENDPARTATLQRIIDQVYRAHEMIADLMFYANPPSAVRKKCNLSEIVHRVANGFEEEVQRQAIRLEVTSPGEPVEALVDENMIGEAVRALIRNAVDAIGCQGTIVVSLVREQNRLMIHIADSGPGLSDQSRKHAFDPYFSGREAGRGLGLGLCRAYRIAKLHFADITLAGGPTGCVATIKLADHSAT